MESLTEKIMLKHIVMWKFKPDTEETAKLFLDGPQIALRENRQSEVDGNR